uniref:catechol O-methyltransferase n=1 Tax=Chromera velia CCMP2878 TaxID=1169474 RepID=A0A0G4G766_9ALVE|mmetsp:Transcript_30867/g.60795  ORF Transcript_30867/g.60795 Transcript_30867/m.60795 type:complete len:311 (+) Transcript_30867:235-1167(+)|eukprot:Cvel_4229.t1-p1 / transcript=Cvel_4229.t1 / gene=Cvel_4229 / organism=Chromera_velia_CCMP2878 / gene_product=Catechol O-methyltransferase, putative / transcript_product=Catechol O-methyltransferase, putative / location=Cvel_scaffold183:18577-19506(-) / protein_length=310 / sequence_SO=supercontig / SO=protein_coding / is_pseudo=false
MVKDKTKAAGAVSPERGLGSSLFSLPLLSCVALVSAACFFFSTHIWTAYHMGLCIIPVVSPLDLGLHFSLHLKALDFVLHHPNVVAKSQLPETDPARAGAVIDAIDELGHSGTFMMNVGDVKGEILDEVLERKLREFFREKGDGEEEFLLVEFGTYIGYGTLRIGRVLRRLNLPEDQLWRVSVVSIDPSSATRAVASVLWETAGVRSLIDYRMAFSGDVLAELKEKHRKIDFLFIDHLKHLYLPDLEFCLENDLLKSGAVVVGDNLIWPGAPDFKKFVVDRTDLFETEIREGKVEYLSWTDHVGVSVFKK